MLSSAELIKINNKYNEAIQYLKTGITTKVVIGNLERNVKLIYLVSLNAIELGILRGNNIQPLDSDDIRILKAGYADKHKILNMIDVADNLNTHSKLKADREVKR